MLSQPLTGRSGGVGGVFMTKPQVQGTDRPLKFLRTVIFLKIKRDGNEKFLWQDHQNRQLTLMS
ncbi:terminase [Enterobacteriaceae bacterium ENNIH3]|nr:terminase [Enterobacteriaceae bacterium ENNIH3]AUV06760.1 terminase [Enterobacteriaceae bacterium ENNIH2]